MLAFARVLENCPRCGHDDVRRSRRPRGVLLRLLGRGIRPGVGRS